MNYAPLATVWAALEQSARVLILTEAGRLDIARAIAADLAPFVAGLELADMGAGTDYRARMRCMSEQDLLIILLTADGFIHRGYRDCFSPFAKPAGFVGKYIFIRLDIPAAALRSGLQTSREKVETIIRSCRDFNGGKHVRVTAAGGTDITVRVAGQHITPYDASPPGGFAFLPPAEVWEDLAPAGCNGVIVADITVGELRFGPELVDPLGRVDSPVTLTVRNGLVTDIEGGDIARRLRAGLDRLNSGLRQLVELGHGLSDLEPTGIIGVDESMNGTCHFGIGAHNPYHIDVVVAHPAITVVD